MKRSTIYRYMFVAMLLLNLIIWVKVSTDIFLAFAPFLCISMEEDTDDIEQIVSKVKIC